MVSSDSVNSIEIDDNVIPDSLNETRPLPSQTIDFTRGIYYTAYTLASQNFPELLGQAKAASINTIVFDLKNMHGDIFFSRGQKDSLTAENIIPIINIDETVKSLHDQDMKAVSRVVMFHDRYLAGKYPELRPQTESGNPWQEYPQGEPSWLDPSNPKVQNHLLTLIEEIASSGIDELQMDYIRFPTQGSQSEAIFHFQKEDSLKSLQDSTYIKRSRSDIIEQFIKEAYDICSKHGTRLTADVFAIVSWQRKVDIESTGQDIRKISIYLNAIHPMIYSSHFDKNFGFRKDAHNEPYYLVYQAIGLLKSNITNNCLIIPYLQANNWRVNYKSEYISAQLQAVKDTDSDGYILWNSANRYAETLKWITNR
ncbi:MAG: hypothetical protein JW996_05145 [Candidatus Cloacimonetes bacterium]|nr:hypothetical protein [Candidatus Cloacimonadota bacterium]